MIRVMGRPKGTGRNGIATSIRVSPLCKKLWDTLSNRIGVSNTGIIEMAIRQMAAREGLDADKIAKELENDLLPRYR